MEEDTSPGSESAVLHETQEVGRYYRSRSVSHDHFLEHGSTRNHQKFDSLNKINSGASSTAQIIKSNPPMIPPTPTRSVSASTLYEHNGRSDKSENLFRSDGIINSNDTFDAADYFIESMKRSNFTDNESKSSTALNPNPPIPPDGMVSPEEVIRDSIASSRNTLIYTDSDDFGRGRRSDNSAYSFSFSATRSTFRRSTISEQMLRETEQFEPERELSFDELSKVLRLKHQEHEESIEMTSIKTEEDKVKRDNARYRWAQHMKLKARNLLFIATSNSANDTWNDDFLVSESNKLSRHSEDKVICAPKELKLNSIQGTGRIVTVASLAPSAPSSIPALAKWMQEQYQSNIMNKRFPFGTHPSAGATTSYNDTPMKLISIEEIVSNPQMMRYYAASFSNRTHQSKLFFLCSFHEYRHFWCTLRVNYLEAQKSLPQHRTKGARGPDMSMFQPFSKDDVLLLRTYGVKIAQKYLAKNAQFHIGAEFVNSDLLRRMKRNIAAGGEDALHAFDIVVTRVKHHLMKGFTKFRQTELYTDMLKRVPREVIYLEDILMNHRFANFFWIFLFPHHYHREIALWLDIEYEFKPSYRQYAFLMRSQGREKESIELVDHHCRGLVKYIVQKYYKGDVEMQGLERSLTRTYAKLQQEQDSIMEKFGTKHLELYHRFLTSRAYAEFSLYHTVPPSTLDASSMDDFQRLATLLLDYGLRAHTWPAEMSRFESKKYELSGFVLEQGNDAMAGIMTFEAIEDSTGQGQSSKYSIKIVEHSKSKDSETHTLDKMFESFLVPWSTDPFDVVSSEESRPSPIAFNFRVGDSNSSTALNAACLVMHKLSPGSICSDGLSKCYWIPYGICITSKFSLVDTLRERISEAFEYVIESDVLNTNTPPEESEQVFAEHRIGERVSRDMDPKLIAKLARPVRVENEKHMHVTRYMKSFSDQPKVLSSLPKSSPLAIIPLLDHSVRPLFDLLDVSTLILVFSALLLECRVLFISSYLSVLFKAAETAKALIYPLLWPHIYVPVLPRRMLQYLECPTPFIFGVNKSWLDETMMEDLLEEDMLIIDLDMGRAVGSGANSIFKLPTSTIRSLRKGLYEQLKPSVTKSDHIFAHQFPARPPAFPEFAIRALFQTSVLDLIGDFGYHRYVWKDERSNAQMIFFDEASYLAGSPPEKREFLTSLIATQALSEFVVSFTGFEYLMSSDSIKSRGIERKTNSKQISKSETI
uniref:Uncharacterized protein AlNc14C111G6403 n=1 Tax=Albugo laibachii Nc14 TaxID=890382 RepID=F0WIK3_9STRA|nr:conserved hypothetical protein [Albugo laibachii Nc14]|eukprot:CCA21087.1 conserved hypothetical protein [Albugo laibachii Nc14]